MAKNKPAFIFEMGFVLTELPNYIIYKTIYRTDIQAKHVPVSVDSKIKKNKKIKNILHTALCSAVRVTDH